jgi:hypothetical protein
MEGKWLLDVLLNTRNVFITGCCLWLLAAIDFPMYRESSYRLGCVTDHRAAFDGLHVICIGDLRRFLPKVIQISLEAPSQKFLERDVFASLAPGTWCLPPLYLEPGDCLPCTWNLVFASLVPGT